MKLQAARVAAFLAAPDAAVRAALVYGPDQGLVRERADRIAVAVVPPRPAPGGLGAGPGAPRGGGPAGGGAAGRDAGDAGAAQFERFFAEKPPGDSFVLVEAGDLAARSALRRAFEAARQGAAIACYADSAEELKGLVRSVMAQHRITVGAEAMD